MGSDNPGRLRSLGRGVARYGCLVPLLIPWFWIAPRAGLLLVGAPLLAYLVMRLLTLHQMQAFMRREGQSAGLALPAGEEKPGPPPDNELRFQELDETVDIALSPAQAIHLRQAVETGPETWRIFLRSFWTLGAVLCGLSLGWALYLLVRAPIAEGWDVLIVWGLVTLPLLLQVWITRRRFLSLQRVPVGSSLAVYLAVGGIMAFLIAYGGVLPPGAYLFLLAFAAGIGVLLRGHGKLIRRLRESGDHPLLILRVFGADANTVFVFGEIMHRWCFLGSYATIADPSYVRFEGSLASRDNNRLFWIATAAYIVFLTAAGFLVEAMLEFWTSFQIVAAVSKGIDFHGPFELVVLLAGVLLICSSAVLAWVRSRRKFSSTLQMLRKGAPVPAQAAARRGVFKGYALYCYDDAWKPAVASLLSSVHVVLMDVRGFTPERRGCEYELGLLIQRFPIDRAVLLIDDGPSKAALFALLQDQWGRMSADSPNRGVKNPTLKTYAPGVEDPEDITRILALLASSLPAQEGTAFDAAGAQELLIPGVKTAQKKGAVGMARLGDLDLALPKPRVAKIAIPLILAGVVAYSWYRVQPVIAAYRSLPLSCTVYRVPVVKPEQRITVDLDALLPGHGWRRLSHPRLDGRGRFDLIRFGPGDGMQILAEGDLRDVGLYFFRADGSEITSFSEFAGSGTTYMRRKVALADLQAGARWDIVLGPDRSQK